MPYDGPTGRHRNHPADVLTAFCELNGLYMAEIIPTALSLAADMPGDVAREYRNGWWLSTTGTVVIVQRLKGMLDTGRIKPTLTPKEL